MAIGQAIITSYALYEISLHKGYLMRQRDKDTITGFFAGILLVLCIVLVLG